jgi:hypothetical protein
VSRWPNASRRFPPPWRAEPIPGGYVVRDANRQALAYLYSRDNEDEARQAKVLRTAPISHVLRASFSRSHHASQVGAMHTTSIDSIICRECDRTRQNHRRGQALVRRTSVRSF